MYRIFIILILIILIGCSNIVENNSMCMPSSIKSKGAWIGGDGGFSVVLPNGNSIWLFGDTLLGTSNNLTMVGNTIGISKCEGDNLIINYMWYKTTEEYLPFFYPGTNNYRFWPVDGFFHNDQMYFLLNKVRNIKDGGPLGFEALGPTFAKVSNPLEDPSLWKVTYKDFQISTNLPYIGVGSTKDENYYYVYNAIGMNAGIGRIPLEHLDAADKYLTFWTNNNTWKKEPNVENLKISVKNVGTAMFPYYNEYLDKWTVFVSSHIFGSNEILFKTAERPEGPWSEGTVVYNFPEMNTEGVWNQVICYAVREHPEYRTEQEMLISYACNSLDPDINFFTSGELFHPKFVKINVKDLK